MADYEYHPKAPKSELSPKAGSGEARSAAGTGPRRLQEIAARARVKAAEIGQVKMRAVTKDGSMLDIQGAELGWLGLPFGIKLEPMPWAREISDALLDAAEALELAALDILDTQRANEGSSDE